MASDNATLTLSNVSKTFTLHLQGGQRIPVLRNVDLQIPPGRCVVLGGESGAGKSTILKMVHGSYGVDTGRILIRHRGAVVDLASATAREILAVRRDTVGYVSQFLRAVPRVGALDVVAEPILHRGVPRATAQQRAAALLSRLSIPERLWHLPPATFSGGEQQRVNIARGFACTHSLLLLDEPTASLDDRNRDVVVQLIRERLDDGTAILAIFHDTAVRASVADEVVDVRAFAPAEVTTT